MLSEHDEKWILKLRADRAILLGALEELADTIADDAPAYAVGPKASKAHKRARAAIAAVKEAA